MLRKQIIKGVKNGSVTEHAVMMSLIRGEPILFDIVHNAEEEQMVVGVIDDVRMSVAA